MPHGAAQLLRDFGAYDLEGRVDIYFHEQLVDSVLEIARSNSWNYHLVEQIVDGILPTHPADAIPLCKQQAESIMDAGKAQIYRHAAKWLQKARDASMLAGRGDEWLHYRNRLLQVHGRKYKLVPILNGL